MGQNGVIGGSVLPICELMGVKGQGGGTRWAESDGSRVIEFETRDGLTGRDRGLVPRRG